MYNLRSCEVFGFFYEGLPVTESDMDLEKYLRIRAETATQRALNYKISYEHGQMS